MTIFSQLLFCNVFIALGSTGQKWTDIQKNMDHLIYIYKNKQQQKRQLLPFLN